MQTIVIKNNDVIGHKVTKYPDGQRSVALDLRTLDVKKPISIICSIKNFHDLELLSCVVNSLKRNDFLLKVINFKYLFGMRSDRCFEHGDCNYFRDVVAPIINSFGVHCSILDAHSELSSWALNKVNTYTSDEWITGFDYPVFFIGADQRSDAVVFKQPHFKKKRCKDFSIDMHLDEDDKKYILDNVGDKTIVINDDLCDAGGTFIRAAEYIREKLKLTNRLELYVTHGLFTKGVDNVAPYFDRIITTNSYQDIEHPKVHQLKVI